MESATTKVETFVDETYRDDFMQGMQHLRQNGEYTDVTLQSGDVQIQCHRVVLAVASDYFKAMFRCGLEETTSDKVQLTMQPDILTSIVDYMYTGDIELTVGNVESLVKACDVLKLDTLKPACENFMMNQVEPDNCVGFYRYAALYRLDKLQQNARRVLLSEFKTAILVDEFKELSCSELVEFIKDDAVNVEYEDVVFEAVLDWVQHDLDNRKQSLETIIEHVRLLYCSRNYLRHIRNKGDLMTPKCFEYLYEAMSFQADTVHQHEISSCRTVPRNNFRMKSALLVFGGFVRMLSKDAAYNRCEYYVEDKNCWESLMNLPHSVGKLYNACCVDRGLLLTGGLKGDAMDQCWLYDLATKKWEVVPPVNTARYYHGSVSLGDCVYVVGGMGVGGRMLASVECLNLKRRLWSSMPGMPQAVIAPMVVTYGNKIFVFGGRDAQGVDLCSTQAFDTTRDQWHTLAGAPEACSIGAAVTLNDCIYVVGGFDRTCLKYDPSSDYWTILSRPQQEHGNAPAVVVRGLILVAGGGGTKPESSVIEEYNPITDTWSYWKTTLGRETMCHYMFNVDLYGLGQ